MKHSKDSSGVDCLHCDSSQVTKNGKLLSGGQRRKCADCSKQFSVGGARDTYSPDFKEKVVQEYCHDEKRAREVLKKYGISSRTLIKRKKEHQIGCSQCNE